MRTIRCALFALIFAALFSCSPLAVDVLSEEAEILQVRSLQEALDGDVADQMAGLSPEKPSDFGKELWRMVTSMLSGLQTPLRSALTLGAKLMAAVILCAAAQGMDKGFSENAVRWAGAAALTAVFIRAVTGLSGSAQETVDRIADFNTLLLPVLSGAMAASGAAAASASLYAASSLVFSVLSAIIRRFLLPMVNVYILLSAAECAAGSDRFGALRELGGWSISTALKAVVAAFTGYLTLTGLLSGKADTMALKAAKAVSGAVPVVGSMLSDASEAILAGAGVLRASAGIYGMLAIFAIGLAPLGRMAVLYLVMRLITAVSGTVGNEAHTKLLGNLSSASGYLLGMTAAVLFMALVSVCCFLKAVTY